MLITKIKVQKTTNILYGLDWWGTPMHDLYIENQEKFGFIYLPSKNRKEHNKLIFLNIERISIS